MKIQCFIIDDEPGARFVLRKLIEKLPEEIEISIAKLAKIKQESYQALKDIQKQIELKEEELNTANSVKSREVAEKEFLALQNQLLVQQQYIIAIDENLASYNKQIEKNSAIQSVENSTSLGAQLKELRFKENEDSLKNFLNLNQQKIKELISLVNPGFENDFLSRSEEHSKSINELNRTIAEEEERLKKIEEEDVGITNEALDIYEDYVKESISLYGILMS